MKKTIKDIEKISEVAISYAKSGLYYLFIPVILVIGFSTMNRGKSLEPQSIWSKIYVDLYNLIQLKTFEIRFLKYVEGNLW